MNFDTLTYMYDSVIMGVQIDTRTLSAATYGKLRILGLSLSLTIGPAAGERHAAAQTGPAAVSSGDLPPTAVALATPAPQPAPEISRAAEPAVGTTGPVRLAIDTVTRQGDHYVASLVGGGAALLTLSPRLQEAAGEVFRSFNVAVGAAVVISIADGKVLALAGNAAATPNVNLSALTLRAWAPAASVFKVVSAAALVSEGGLHAGSRACYHGGVSSILKDNLVDIPRLDTRCDTLAYAIGKSQNAIVAKLATQHLQPDSLERVATAFGFGQQIAFDAPVEPSSLEIPTDGLEFARAAAGFWHSSLSPLHGALLAAAVANGGLMPAPRLIEKAIGADGVAVSPARRISTRVVDQATAVEVGHMMEMTTRMGTAKGTFRSRRGERLLPVDVAGKTGTLAFRGEPGDPALPGHLVPQGSYLGYSWFVGFAPADHPRIAFAVLIGNRANWRIKAPFVAKRLVTEYLASEGDIHAGRMLAAR